MAYISLQKFSSGYRWKHGEIKHGWGSRWKKSDVLFTVDVKVVVMDSGFDEGK